VERIEPKEPKKAPVDNIIELVEVLRKIKPVDKKRAKFNASAMVGRNGEVIVF
jgi:hypothetical protein